VQIAPFGYAWVFDNGNNTYKIGVCEVYMQATRNLPSLNTRLDGFLQHLVGQNKLKILEKHAGTIVSFKNVPYSMNRILAIGDAAGTINPLLEEGIRHSLYSAMFAYESIVDNISNNSPLTRYDQKIRHYKNMNWRLSNIVSSALYGKNTRNTQELYTQLVIFARCLSQTDALAIFRDYSFLPIMKHFPQNISLLKSLMRTMI
jgi:flavin-dependent dehydrogenase